MDSKFDKLYNMFMEEVNSSKKTVIKESASIQETMDAIRVAADIIKRAMAVNKDKVLEELERDVNYDSSCCRFEDYDGEGITREMWENTIKYGWMAETLFYFIGWHDDLFKDITPEENAILENVDIYSFSEEFEKGNLEGLDFCKEICSMFPEITIDPKELMIHFAGEEDDRMSVQSVKKPVSKMRKHHIIKESTRRALKKLTSRVIKEETETDEPDYSLPEDDPCHWWGKKDVAAVKAAMAKAGVTCPENKIAGVLAQCCGDLYWNGFREPEQLDGYPKKWWDEMIADAPEHFTNADYPQF